MALLKRSIALILCLLCHVAQGQETVLEKVGELQISIGLESSFEANSLIEDEQHFYFLQRVGEHFSIMIVDKTTLNQIGLIKLANEGPNGISSANGLVMIDGEIGIYQFYSKDIHVIDRGGKIKKTIATESNQYPLTSTLLTYLNPLLIVGENILVPNIAGIDFKTKLVDYQSPTFKFINTSTEEIAYHFEYPENYQNIVAGGWQSIFSFTKGHQSNKVLVSFPLEHDLFLLDEVGEVERIAIEPTLFKQFDGHFYSNENTSSSAPWQKSRAKYWSNYSYGAIIYDKYSKVYSRVINLPIKETASLADSAEEIDYRTYQIQVYNQKFELMGNSPVLKEEVLTINQGKYLITPRGLHLFRKNQDNEEVMQFSTYQLISKE